MRSPLSVRYSAIEMIVIIINRPVKQTNKKSSVFFNLLMNGTQRCCTQGQTVTLTDLVVSLFLSPTAPAPTSAPWTPTWPRCGWRSHRPGSASPSTSGPSSRLSASPGATSAERWAHTNAASWIRLVSGHSHYGFWTQSLELITCSCLGILN